MRITTGSLARGYNSRLNRVLSDLSLSNEKVTTKRKFLRGSENPGLSVRAKRLEREMSNTENHLENVASALDTYESLESSMMQVSKYTDDTYAYVLQAINGTTSPEQRKIIATDIREKQKAAVASLNARFEEKFLMGGSSTKEAPFELKNDKLYFRGIDVDAAPGSTDYAKLQEMSKETMYVDLGFGLDVNNGVVKDTSAFNLSFPGINLVGFGTDSNGLSNNLINTMGNIADLMEKEPMDKELMKGYSDKLDTQKTNLLVNVTQLGSTTIFLNNTLKRLEDNEFILNKKIDDTEYGNHAELIMDFTEQNYVYQAALKMGSKVLSNSFIDYMN